MADPNIVQTRLWWWWWHDFLRFQCWNSFFNWLIVVYPLYVFDKMEVIFFFIPFFLFPVTCVSLSFWQRKMVQRSFLVLGRSFIHHCIKLSKLAKYLCHPYHCNKVLRIGLTISKTHMWCRDDQLCIQGREWFFSNVFLPHETLWIFKFLLYFVSDEMWGFSSIIFWHMMSCLHVGSFVCTALYTLSSSLLYEVCFFFFMDSFLNSG